MIAPPRPASALTRRRSPRAALGVAALSLLAACAEEKASAIVVAFSTELAMPEELAVLSVKATRAGAPKFDQAYRVPSGATLPGTLTFVDTGGEGPVTLLVRGEDGATGRAIEKQVRFTMPAQATRLLRVRLDRACLGVSCSATDTCEAGRCQPVATQEGASLPPYASDADAFRPPGCFDEATCAAGARAVEVTGAACAVAAQPGENVFVEWRASPGRPTLAALDASSSLAPSLCDAWTRGEIARVVASRACPPLAPPRELCAAPPPAVGSGGRGGAGQAGASGGGQAGAGGAGQAGVGGAGQAGVGGAGQAGVGGAGQAGVGGAGQAGAGGAGQAGAGGAGQAGAGGAGQAGAGGAGAGGAGQAGAGGAGAGGGGQEGAGGATTGPPSPVRSLAGTQEAMCALLVDGTAYCWGLNPSGQARFGGAPLPRVVATPTKVPGVAGLTSLSLSATHSCGLDAAGDSWCWGLNDGFALGAAGAGGVFPPIQSSLPKLAQIVAGYHLSCGRDAGGQVVCVGDVAGLPPSATPAPIAGPAGIGSIALASSSASSHAFTCSLTMGGEVYCWGDTAPVQLPKPSLPGATRISVTQMDEVFVANGAKVQRSIGSVAGGAFLDVPQGALTGTITALAAETEACVINDQARLFCVDDRYGQLSAGGFVERSGLGAVTAVGVGWTPLQAGPNSCAAGDADVWCWGDDYSGQLGLGLPHAVPDATPTGLTAVDDATTSTSATLARVGAAWHRAGESRALLAAGASDESTTFVPIPALAGATRAWVGDGDHGSRAYAAFASSFARFTSAGTKLTSGELLAAGSDWTEIWIDGARTFGRSPTLGLWSLAPAAALDPVLGTGAPPDGAPHQVVTGLADVAGFAKYRDAYSTPTHACAWDSAGAATCWGGNSVGQCGVDPTSADEFDTPPPTSAGNLPATSAMCAGWAHTCSLGLDQIVRCWGDDGAGQLGRGAEVGRDWNPAPVVTATGPLSAVAVACGYAYACALGADGLVYCWGANDEGQLGRGTRTAREDVAVAVAQVSDAQRLIVNADHACAIAGATRALVCWGSSYWGQLGLGVRGFELPPTKTIW